mgnify:CR=1 FL=1
MKAGQNVSVDEATDNATGQKTYTVNADLSGAKVYAGVGTDGSGVAKALRTLQKLKKVLNISLAITWLLNVNLLKATINLITLSLTACLTT